MKKDVFGSEGDFITAPEISQIFGEVNSSVSYFSIKFIKTNIFYFKLVGVWFLNEWIILKKIYENDLPDTVELIEMGPGKGTLINDVLRVN